MITYAHYVAGFVARLRPPAKLALSLFFGPENFEETIHELNRHKFQH
ncbi:MAG: hypothetical protein NVSMB56_19960 [Pyrinomonadaceae bacterium]